MVRITPDPTSRGEAFEGWGTSLAWFANGTGGLPDRLRLDLVDKVFGPDGLNLNIARYNIGGGNAVDVPAYLRPGGAVEGWWNPDGLSDDRGPVTARLADRQRYRNAWRPDDLAAWNLDADATQRWWVDAIRDRVTRWEAFSNSPPWFLTESGFVSGGLEPTTEQLPIADLEKFAAYLVRVVEFLEQAHGISFDTLDPMNEPNTDYWSTRLGPDGLPTLASRQEGAHVGPARQAALITALRAELDAPGRTTRVEISGPDETNPGLFVDDWNGWTDEARAAVAQLNVHTYGTERRPEVREIASTSGKRLWMSEVEGDWAGPGFDPSSIANGLGMAQQIVDDLRELAPVAWVFWQPIEDLYNVQRVQHCNWGSIYVDFDCDEDGNSLRRLADGDPQPAVGILTNAKYNTVRNFTHHLRPGDHLVATDDPHTTAALPATGDGLTLVHVNADETERQLTLDLSGFAAIAPDAAVRPLVTTQPPAGDVTANALVPGAPVPVDAQTSTAVVTVPARSVTTLLVTGVTAA